MKKYVKFIISATISIILIYFLFTKINIAELLNVLLKANFILVLGGFIFYFILVLIRTLRFRILFKNSISFLELFPIVCKHTFFNVIVPFKLGELSFIYLLKKKKHSIGKSLSSLIVARIFDFLIIISTFIMILIFFSKSLNNEIFTRLLPFSIILFFVLITSLIFVLFFANIIIKILEKLKLNKLTKIITPFNELRTKHILLKSFFLSISHYMISMVSTYLIMIAIGFNLPLYIFIITITLSTLSGLLPINGVAGLGTVEAVIALVLSYFGYSAAESIVFGFSIHIIQIFFVIIIGLIGWTFPFLESKYKS